jgi:predicted nucleic acid-binding protein
MRILFDTNVVLDVLLEREPFVEASTRAVNAHVQNHVDGLLGATTITTLFYLVSTVRGAQAAHEHVEELLSLFEIAAVNRRVLERAAASGFADFEDAVLHEAARGAGGDGIVTRNESDFTEASLSIYTPEELLAILGLKGNG